MFRDATLELAQINLTNLCNICVSHLKKKNWKEVIKFAEDALVIDHKCAKALFMKGKGLEELTEFEKAIDVFTDLVEFHPEHEEGIRELAKC